MHRLAPIAQYLVSVAAAAGCAAAFAMRAPQPQDVPHLGSAELRQTYLDCVRIASESVLEPDLFTVCSTVADVLLRRDFRGNFELQLQWRKDARGDTAADRSASATESLQGPGQGEHAR